MQAIKLQPSRFINAEPGLVPFEFGAAPVVVLSFGAEDGPIEDRAINVVEARQLVVDLLSSLAQMGDPLAQAIGNQFFGDEAQGEVENDENAEPEFDTGSNYDDGCNGGCCG